MSHKPLRLKEGAIFLSDAHYSFKHRELIGFLKALRSQTIQTPQLILMGDVFDLLFGNIPATIARNQEAVDLINTLSDNIEIVYLEGNHDFNLSAIFPGVEVYPIKQQPVICSYKEESVALAHGDFNGPLGYRIYTALIRNPVVLSLLNLINKIGKQCILKALDDKLKHKDDCHKMHSFEQFVEKHLGAVELAGHTMFIEGHHHQNRSFQLKNCRYINLPAFACGRHYMRLDSEGVEQKTYAQEKER